MVIHHKKFYGTEEGCKAGFSQALTQLNPNNGIIFDFCKKGYSLDTVFLVAKYIFLGIFIFLGAVIFTKSVSKLVDNAKNKEENDKS
jgi:hypothetical protein